MSPKDITRRVFSVVPFLDTPTDEEMTKIIKLLKESKKQEGKILAIEYQRLYDETIRLEREYELQVDDIDTGRIYKLLDDLSQNYRKNLMF